MPPPTLQVTLDPDAQAELERRYHTTRDATDPHPLPDGPAAPRATPHPRSPGWSAAAPTPSAGCSTATWPTGPTRCRTGPTPASRPTTRPDGSKSWSGSPTWTPTRSGWTAPCGAVGCWPTTWPRGHRPRCGDRDGPDRAAPRRVCLQAAPLGAVAQGPGPAGVGKKRLRVEALLAAAASPLPPPAVDLVPDPTLAADLFPRGSAAPAGPAGACRSVPARRGRGRPAPDPDPGVVAGWPIGPAAGAGAWHQRQAVRLRAGGLARGVSGLGAGRGPPRRAVLRPVAPRGGPLPLAWPDRHGDLGQPGHPHPQGVAAAAGAAGRAGRAPGAGLHPDL